MNRITSITRRIYDHLIEGNVKGVRLLFTRLNHADQILLIDTLTIWGKEDGRSYNQELADLGCIVK
jgi:hypothetical protein